MKSVKEELDNIRQSEYLGICVKIAMTSRNVDAKKFAEAVDVTPAQIYAIIKNDRKPSWRLLRDMLICLGLTSNQFSEIIDYYKNYKGEQRYTDTLRETLERVVQNLDAVE